MQLDDVAPSIWDESRSSFDKPIASARESIEDFVAVLESPKRAHDHFLVRVEVAHLSRPVWVADPVHHESEFVVRIGDNQEFRLPEAEVVDWLFVDNGRLVGGSTFRLERDSLTEDARFRLDLVVPFVVADDLSPLNPEVAFFDKIGHGEVEEVRRELSNSKDLANILGEVILAGGVGMRRRTTARPLGYAVAFDDLEAVETLIAHGAAIDGCDRAGVTALHRATNYGHLGCVKVLAARGADVNKADNLGRTPLKSAAERDLLEAAAQLLEFGADVSPRTKLGSSLLHNIKSVEMARLLARAGGDLAVVDSRGSTPLHVAVFNGRLDVAIELLKLGASPNVLDDEGKTPLEVAHDLAAKRSFDEAELEVFERISRAT